MVDWIIGNEAMDLGLSGWTELAGRADETSFELYGMRRRKRMEYS
jgi:hypothetical protein